MKYSSFLRVVHERHGHAKFAFSLYVDRKNTRHVFVPAEIPCAVACMLRYGLPAAVASYLDVENAL